MLVFMVGDKKKKKKNSARRKQKAYKDHNLGFAE